MYYSKVKFKFITSIIIFLVGFSVNAQNINVNRIDSFINHIENNNRGIGSVSIFKKGKEIYNRSFGQKELGKVKYNDKTKYQIGSITKMITATLIFDLIENNQLSLDEKLSNFYPNIPNSENITIRNLLEHSSGLGDFTMKNDSIWLTKQVTEKEILEEIIKQGVTFQAGQKVEYSNSGYFLLTKILEKIHNQNYARIITEKITNPLNIENLESITEKTKNTFESYGYNQRWEKIKDFEFSNVVGVGDIVSTTNNLNIFLFDLFNYNLVTKSSVEQMKPIEKELFGRGLMLIPFNEHIFYGHGGNTYGTHSVAAYNQSDQIGLSFAINGERFHHNDFAIGILSIIYGKEYDFPNFNTITLKTEDLDKFLGTYSSPEFPLKLTITKEKNNLKGQGTGQPEFSLECYDINKFKFDKANLKIEFIPQENKLLLNQGGKKIEMNKE